MAWSVWVKSVIFELHRVYGKRRRSRPCQPCFASALARTPRTATPYTLIVGGNTSTKRHQEKMRFLLRLKHWQLFLLTIGLPILADIFGISGPGRSGTVDVIIGLVTVSGVFGWIWAIANELHIKLPDKENFKLWRFRLLFFIALTILVWVFWTFLITRTRTDSEFPIIFLTVPIYLAIMVFLVLFAAKTLRTVELGRPANISEYGGEAFLIWMIPIGVWILQPRLNKLTED